MIIDRSRRHFIKYLATGSGSLFLATFVGGCKSTSYGFSSQLDGSKNKLKTLYLEVTKDNQFFLTFDKAEMGQGVMTGQATLFGEEADIHPKDFTMIPALADERYNTELGIMLTGGSTSTKDRFFVLRRIAAGYRQQIRQAAASSWKVPLSAISTDNGQVIHEGSGKKLPYAAFNSVLSKLEPLDINDIQLKKKEDWQYIGKFQTSLDALEKSKGSVEFGIDFSVPGMKTAIVIRPPRFGAKLKSFDAEKIKALGEVADLFGIDSGLAIICQTYWRCLSVKAKLQPTMIVWDFSEASKANSTQLEDEYRQLLAHEPSKVAEPKAVVSAQYSLPFLCHAPMEPQNAVAWLQKDQFDLWVPSQAPTLVQSYAEKKSGLESHQVSVRNAKYLGGGFGRRAQIDYVVEVIDIAVKVNYPIKLQWSREDDMQHSAMRPMSMHSLEAVIATEIKEWRHKIVSESIAHDLAQKVMPIMVPQWVASTVESTLEWAEANPMAKTGAEQPYNIPYDIEAKAINSPIPVSFWRSVSNSHNGFVVESFLDEVAYALGQDPIEYRLHLLKANARAKAVLKKVQQMSGWQGFPAKQGHALGAAYHFSFETHCAQVAEVKVQDSKISVVKVFAAVDCGIVVNPDMVRKQLQSAIVDGSSAALKGRVELKDGGIVQSNFHDYPLFRLDETPDIEVAIIDSDAQPTGIGEPGLPPIAAALGNGIFRAIGKRCRNLPFSLSS